ncbi:GTPase Era [Coxiella endosymbiont of Amblyomma sculptum]|uniref:GTPase Era n=1 Tax=Coxiella endosymbiont of Amblyomma sculptum TaxID=2487929 RepID=UPI00132F00BB|nr:GTPase Era [Coxiella endosymbiont of Amblyomma sculptum]QHG92295.1 GTPase Era [Coxiella endosymbiont of Amblyomma sculptum]
MKNRDSTHFGYTVIIGRPNVGKSSLLNRIVGSKISITSCKPRTTRCQILGIKTFRDIQVAYIDTPGFHLENDKNCSDYISWKTLQGVDLIIFVIEPYWNEQDVLVLKQLQFQSITTPTFLVINKIDRMKNFSELLPLIKKTSFLHPFSAIIPISVKTGDQVGILEQKINDQMPKSFFCFSPGQTTDRNDQFLAIETIREKLMRFLHREIPYSLKVTISMFQREEKMLSISAVIWVAREGQKGIVIGKYGKWIKKVGITARVDMEKLFRKKIFLQLWVKLRENNYPMRWKQDFNTFCD